MDSMFQGCKSLIQLDLSGFITSNVVNMSEMFSGCSNLMQLGLSNFNTSKVIYMWRMFYECKALIQLDLSNFDTSKVFNMNSMFNGCDALITIYISDKWKTNKMTEDAAMFNDCYSLQNFSPEKTDIEMAKPIEQGGYLTLKKQSNNITKLTQGIPITEFPFYFSVVLRIQPSTNYSTKQYS